MREALRNEHQNHEQQNLIRVAENLELTKELNKLRKKNAVLEAEITRREGKAKVQLPSGGTSNLQYLQLCLARPGRRFPSCRMERTSNEWDRGQKTGPAQAQRL